MQKLPLRFVGTVEVSNCTTGWETEPDTVLVDLDLTRHTVTPFEGGARIETDQCIITVRWGTPLWCAIFGD